MPKSTLKSILEKLQNTEKNGTTYVISVRISKEVMLILYIVTDNISKKKIQITSILKKFKWVLSYLRFSSLLFFFMNIFILYFNY